MAVIVLHQVNDLISIFNRCFTEEYNTKLVRGGEEPIYLPACPSQGRIFHEIHFAHGFFSSALHECAHWFIAGKNRRLLEDFGYWYYPDGRNQAQQTLFEQVEIKPQAIEWILSEACQYRFQFSIDNLNSQELLDTTEFKSNVLRQKIIYQQIGLPKRAQCFYNALITFYHT